MDGIGFIANLHATTLDAHGSEPLLLKPLRRQTRSSSAGSMSSKAKNFVSRSVSFFSSQSSSDGQSSVHTRTSISTLSPRSSINGPASSIKRTKSLLETHSEFTSSNSSPVTSEDRKNCPCAKTLHQLGNHIKCSRDHCDTSRGSSSNHGGCRESQCYLDAAWISTLVDNKYISPTDSSPESSPQQDDADLDSDIEPSRASSMLDRDFDLASLTFDESPKLPHPALPPVLSFSIAEQLAQTEDSHGARTLGSQNMLQPELVHEPIQYAKWRPAPRKPSRPPPALPPKQRPHTATA